AAQDRGGVGGDARERLGAQRRRMADLARQRPCPGRAEGRLPRAGVGPCAAAATRHHAAAGAAARAAARPPARGRVVEQRPADPAGAVRAAGVGAAAAARADRAGGAGGMSGPMTDPLGADRATPSPFEPRRFDVLGELPAEATTTMLEASAGTGKTWTIAALVVRMVAEGVAPLEQMLVVTFGRAASQELRERVRERLVAVERAFTAAARGEPVGDPERPDPVLDLLLAADEQERALRHRRLREALGRFDAATIATTHQFCQMVLKGLGVAGDTDADATLVEDLDDLLVEVLDDLYLRGFAKAERPEFSRGEARAVARAAAGDPSARLEPRSAAQGTPAARRLRFAEAVRAEMEVRKRRLGVLSYDDLLSQLACALEDEDSPARQRMRQRWSVVLVDEFQDTDPVQW